MCQLNLFVNGNVELPLNASQSHLVEYLLIKDSDHFILSLYEGDTKSICGKNFSILFSSQIER